MINISKQTLKLDCSECKRSITVSIKQIANEELVKCSCGQAIQLQDNNGANKNAIRDIKKSFKDLEDTFKNLGR